MDLSKLAGFATSVVIAIALTGNLDKFTRMVQLETLKLLKESQASNWGNPSIFKEEHSYQRRHKRQN